MIRPSGTDPFSDHSFFNHADLVVGDVAQTSKLAARNHEQNEYPLSRRCTAGKIRQRGKNTAGVVGRSPLRSSRMPMCPTSGTTTEMLLSRTADRKRSCPAKSEHTRYRFQPHYPVYPISRVCPGGPFSPRSESVIRLGSQIFREMEPNNAMIPRSGLSQTNRPPRTEASACTHLPDLKRSEHPVIKP